MATKAASGHPAYAAMLLESQRIGWPERFKTDLTVHDFGALCSAPPTRRFAWLLGDSGTGLVWQRIKSPITASSRGGLVDTYATGGAISTRESKVRCYWWDGESLREMSLSELKERIDETCEQIANC